MDEKDKALIQVISEMKPTSSRESVGFIIRHPGAESDPKYCFGNDPKALEEKWFEGFNPVYEIFKIEKEEK